MCTDGTNFESSYVQLLLSVDFLKADLNFYTLTTHAGAVYCQFMDLLFPGKRFCEN